jgi:predicted RNA-binding protein
MTKKCKLSLAQTSLLKSDNNNLGTIRELVTSPTTLEFIKKINNQYRPQQENLLLIPETRKQPFTKSIIYKKISKFLRGHNLESKTHIVFISNVLGVCPEEFSADENIKFELLGGSYPDMTVIQRTGKLVADYLVHTKDFYKNRVAYCRSSYLESVKIASKLSGIEVLQILNDSDLYTLKRAGIKWMKLGLRMPEAISILEKKVVNLFGSENAQAKLTDYSELPLKPMQ